jgi:hypothetical protein
MRSVQRRGRPPRAGVDKARRALKALSRSFPRIVKKQISTLPSYSPRGIGDEPPNVRDSRYTFPVGDEPVVLPMQPQGKAFLIAVLVIAMLVAMFTAAASNL